MLERLVGRLLNKVLSKYFTYNASSGASGDDPTVDNDSSSAQPSLGVWSGYISLENLQLKTDVVNDLFQKRGIPLEVIHCSIRRVEITVPWSKLRETTNNNNNSETADAGAVVVIVMDGIHILARTLYDFHDVKMKQQDVQQRRAKLQEAQAFQQPHATPPAPPSSSSWFSIGTIKEFVQQRLKEGILQQMTEKLHVHIRDLHVRLEDAETDPARPFACGIIMESMHVQHWENEVATNNSQEGVGEEDDQAELFPQDSESSSSTKSSKDKIRKVAQVNHYALYWNALEYEEGLPLEHSVMHQLPSLNTSQLLVAALDRGIARRANTLSSIPGGRIVVPTHNYLLMPMDCSLQATLTMDPTGNSKIPSINASFNVEAINVQLRDFQLHQCLTLIRNLKEHKFIKPYRRFRPQVPVRENPRAWWIYAFRVISYELKGSRLRWSWGRLRQRYAGRLRYCELYERKLKYDFYASHHHELSDLVEATFDTTPDDGAGPSVQSETNSLASSESQLVAEQRQSPETSQQRNETPRPLTEMEGQELQDLEDGVSGDLAVSDILLYRMLVHGRLGHDYHVQQKQAQEAPTSWLFGNSLVQNAIQDDTECQQEVERLKAYLEHSSKIEEKDLAQEKRNLVFLTVHFKWKQGCLAIFSPLPSTAQEPSLLRRLHERFLDFTFERLTLGFILMGDYGTANISVSLQDYTINEIRSNQERQKFAILSRRRSCDNCAERNPQNSAGQALVTSSEIASSDPLLGASESSSRDDKPHMHPQENSRGVAPQAQEAPLFFLEIGINPLQQQGCARSIKAKLEKVEIVMVPDCQWIRRLKAFIRHSASSVKGRLEDYWKHLNYASINAWAERRLGFRAKAETAMKSHKPTHWDIHVSCPIIQIVGSDSTQLWVDIGSAHLKTVKLAGVAAKKLNESIRTWHYDISETSKALTNSTNETGGSRHQSSNAGQQYFSKENSNKGQQTVFDDTESLGQTILSTSPGLESYLVGPTSSVSFDNQKTPLKRGGRHRKRDRSWGIEESFRSVDGMGFLDAGKSHVGEASISVNRHDKEIHSSFFYDIHQLHIMTGGIKLGNECSAQKCKVPSEEDSLVSGFRVQVNIHKSIIPADHTLCRFRLDCIVGEISMCTSQEAILQLASTSKIWRHIFASRDGDLAVVHNFSESNRYRTRDHFSLSSMMPHPGDSQTHDGDLYPFDSTTENGSNVDEDEFFDAVENDDNSENMMWLEDNWIADAESVLDEDQLSATPRQRRPKSAMSDVSSLSDRSIKRRKPKDSGAYLNEENLAMLEEGMGEEDSLEGSEDSFHSALSPSRVVGLLDELDQNIKDAREYLSVLKSKIDDVAFSAKQNSLSSRGSDTSKNRRMLMKSLKVEQERLRAELNEMVATRDDLSAQLVLLEEASEDPSKQATEPNGFEANARRATILLTRRKKNERSFDANALQHNLTRNLNPQLLQCTVVLNKVSIKLNGVSGSDTGAGPLAVNLCTSQVAVALRHSTNETKAYSSIEHFSVGYKVGGDGRDSPHFVLLAGTQYDYATRLLPSHFPQYISTASMEDKFVKSTVELRHKPTTGNSLSSPEIVRLRVAFGDFEILPSRVFVESLACYGASIKNDIRRLREEPEGIEKSEKLKKLRSPPTYVDLTMRISSVRLVVERGGHTVGALILSEVASRLVKSSTNALYKAKQQLDLRCSNIQVLHVEDLNLGKGSEVLGKRDPYLPLIHMRIRGQLVPSSDTGGWVVGSASRPQQNNDLTQIEEQKIWNAHAGIRVNSVSVVAAPWSLSRLRDAVKELSSSIRTSKGDKSIGSPGSGNGYSGIEGLRSTPAREQDSLQADNTNRPLLRWRADIAIRKTAVTLQNQDGQGWDIKDGARNTLLMTGTVLASLERSKSKVDALNVQLALTDISVVRSLDELHVLDPLDVLVKGNIARKLRQTVSPACPLLKLPVDSPWNEIAAVMHRHGWDIPSEEPPTDTSNCLLVLVTPTKLKLTANLIAFLNEFRSSLSSGRKVSEENKLKELGIRKSRTTEQKAGGLFLSIAARSVDMVLGRERSGKSMDSFASFALRDAKVTLHKLDKHHFLNASITDALVFDLSSRPGVCVLARKQFQWEPERAADGESQSHFVAFKMQTAGDSAEIQLQLQFGNIQCIILPSFVQGLLTFQNDIKSLLPRDGIKKYEKKKGGGIFGRPRDVFFSFVVNGFECIISSRDIFGYMREQAESPINVVSLRWKSDGKAVLVLSGLESASDLARKLKMHDQLQDFEEEDLFKDLIDQYATQMDPFSSMLLASKILLSVRAFQVLRTTLVPHPRLPKDPSPYFFKVHPPTAGEQLITNSFDFNLVYNAFGAKLRFLADKADESRCNFEFAHAIRLEAQLVDVLVYIAQSPGGIHDALRITVKPIMEMLKRRGERDTSVIASEDSENDGRGGAEDSPGATRNAEENTFIGAVKRASTVLSVKAEGIRVTCVPGGATRLTESPIINFSLLDFVLGLAVCPVPAEAKLIAEAGLENLGEETTIVSRFQELHCLLAAWLHCNFSASYHNRRLVAWEPFIEPWTLEAKFGADLVKLINFPRISTTVRPGWHAELQRAENPFATLFNDIVRPESTSERLRDFRNLLRSPFRRSVGTEEEANRVTQRAYPFENDFGYLMLVSVSSKLVDSALHPSFSSSSDSILGFKKQLSSFLPNRSPMKWLACFGYPLCKGDEDLTASSKPSFSCSISDTKPLNVNLTGALIENVLGYLRQEQSRTVAPHWIKNDSGLTIRFREVLDEARVQRGEKASKVTLSNGSEVPLSLKRTFSQSCDPHRAYIFVELGSFEDTVGRVDHQELDIQKGSLSSTFFYKVVAKVPADTVGVHRYPLDRNVDLKTDVRKLGSDSRSLGWIIVRVALHGGIKLVTIESPVALRNNTDSDLLCEVRAHDRLSLLWRHLVPKSYEHEASSSMSFLPVDIVPFLHDESYEFSVEALPRSASFSHESELSSTGGRNSITMRAPPPFSSSSLTRGLIGERDVTFKMWSPEEITGSPIRASTEHVHLNVCSLRLGTFHASQLGNPTHELVPEQRMLLFRSPLAVRNHLAFPIVVQVRVKHQNGAEAPPIGGDFHNKSRWESLGILDCGQTVSWTGAFPQNEVDMRVKFVAKDPNTARRFVTWSSVVTIPPMGATQKQGEKASDTRSPGSLSKLKILDTSGIRLDLSVSISGDVKCGDTSSFDSIKALSSNVAPASRVVSVYVPYWVVDGTSQDLEFASRSLVAGQFNPREDFLQNGVGEKGGPGITMGLAELLEDAKLSHLPSRSSFSILLIGDDRSRKLSVRQRLRRQASGKDVVAPWSEAIPLKDTNKKHFDVTVMPPSRDARYWKEQNGSLEPYALRSRILTAPEKFGGKFGTKIVHVVCRYAIANELGREVEIISERSRGAPVLVRADGKPKPFHFDDSRPLQLRPKEFGWLWSGRFFILSDRREVALRVRHKLKGHTMIVNVEIHRKQKSGTCIIVLRSSNHPPFRFENHTMYPLQFVQTYLSTNEDDIRYNREVASSETVLLPYHHADFAWDEPEHSRKSVKFEIADIGNHVDHPMVGVFNIDRIAPGAELMMDSPLLVGQVVADGPTRVLRITESSMPRLPRVGVTSEVKFKNSEGGTPKTFALNVRLTHGVGVSLVDWSPQELVFLRLDDINVSQRMESDKQIVEASIGRISIDNQLWVSPYPVLLEMGPRKIGSVLARVRRKSRRHRAVSLSLSRPLVSTSLYGDLTFLDWLELVTDPINIYIDGNLVASLTRMMQQALDMRFDNDDSSESSRNSILRKILGIPEVQDGKRKVKMAPADIYSAEDTVTTAAIAAKSRSSRDAAIKASNTQSADSDSSTLSKAMKKCYVEKMRISTTKLEISWSGSLSFFSLPRLIPVSLTFEGFPLLLRPYSTSHAYGTIEEHVQSLRSHYLSIWRMFDLFLGLAVKPTFLFNAVVYTWSESFASILGRITRSLAASRERLLLKLRETKPQPIYEDGLYVAQEASTTSVRSKVVRPFLKLSVLILNATEGVTGLGASLFRYNPAKFGTRRKAELVRARNPRLFANVDGRDLLVEYVEGENAGKAILSRIRMGMHLGEGYIYHIEGLYQKAAATFSKSKKLPGVLILMVTFERMVLVKGDLNADFCTVVWEVTFDNLIHVEVTFSEDPGYEMVTVWYLANSLQEAKKGEDNLMSRYAKSIVGDPDCGLDNLCSIEVYVPQGNVEVLITKVQEAKKLLDHLNHKINTQ